MPAPDIATLPNLRDVGGRPTAAGGRLREGLLFRSVELCNLDDAGLHAFAELGVRTVFDLRTTAERHARSDHVPAGTRTVCVDLLAGADDTVPTEFALLLGDPQHAARLLDGPRVVGLYEWGYRRLVSTPASTSGLRQLYSELAQPGRLPALIHCASGKDRTGWAVAALLLLLGVEPEGVMDDYLLSNEQLLPGLTATFEHFSDQGGDPDVLREVLGVRPEYLAAGIDEMTIRFGSVEGYFSAGLRLDDEVLRRLRSAFVVEPAG